jgi:tRNA (cmo5U34)-methyltransferase
MHGKEADMSVGHNIVAKNSGWTFGENVPDTFVEHIKSSVPLYEESHELGCQISSFFVRNTSVVYELGTSTGEMLKKLALHNAAKKSSRFIGLEVEEAMVRKALQHCADVPNVQIVQEDIRLASLEKADLIVSYYTMCFVPPCDRQQIFDKIYEALNWGGAFILFEKVRAPDARFQDIAVQLYADFKHDNGFSFQEMGEKTRSLKGVMEPFSSQANIDLMKRAGFVDIMTIQKYICFEGFLAIK